MIGPVDWSSGTVPLAYPEGSEMTEYAQVTTATATQTAAVELGRSATVDGVFDTPEPQPRPWRVLGAQPFGPLAVALDRPTTDQSHLDRYFPGSESARYHRKKHVSRLDVAVLGGGSLPEHEARDVVRKAPARIAENADFDGADLVTC